MLISCFLQARQYIVLQRNSNADSATNQALRASFCSFDFDTISLTQVRLAHTLSPQR